MNRRAIGLLHGGALGDFVLSWHLLKAVQRARCGAPLRVWARRPVAGTDPAVWGLDSLLDVESCGWHALFAEGGVCPSDLAGDLESCDLVINFLADRASVLTRNLLAITAGAVVCVEPGPACSPPAHITEQWRRQLGHQGIDSAPVSPATLSLPTGAVGDARRRLESLARAGAARIVLIHPGSGGRAKCWPLDNFFRLAAALDGRGTGVVFVTGPAEPEVLGQVQERALADWPVIADPTLTELTCLCATADVCLGNDSGFAQLAAAAPDSAGLVIFGTTEPAVWRPLGPGVQVLGGAGRWPAFAQVWAQVQGMARAGRRSAPG